MTLIGPLRRWPVYLPGTGIGPSPPPAAARHPRTETDQRMAVSQRPTMMDPPVENLLSKVDSKFTLVTLAAKRGRQINSYFNQLGEGLGAIVPPQVTSVSRKP